MSLFNALFLASNIMRLEGLVNFCHATGMNPDKENSGNGCNLTAALNEARTELTGNQ